MVQLVFLHLGVGLGLQLLHDLLGGDHLGGLVVIQGLVHRRGQRVGQIQLAHGNGRLLNDGDFLRRGSRLLKHRGFGRSLDLRLRLDRGNFRLGKGRALLFLGQSLRLAGRLLGQLDLRVRLGGDLRLDQLLRLQLGHRAVGQQVPDLVQQGVQVLLGLHRLLLGRLCRRGGRFLGLRRGGGLHDGVAHLDLRCRGLRDVGDLRSFHRVRFG